MRSLLTISGDANYKFWEQCSGGSAAPGSQFCRNRANTIGVDCSSFISRERLKRTPRTYPEMAPELVMEVKSAFDRLGTSI
jgi:hypothetical protein